MVTTPFVFKDLCHNRIIPYIYLIFLSSRARDILSCSGETVDSVPLVSLVESKPFRSSGFFGFSGSFRSSGVSVFEFRICPY